MHQERNDAGEGPNRSSEEQAQGGPGMTAGPTAQADDAGIPGEGQVHVWSIPLGASKETCGEAVSVLDATEVQRARCQVAERNRWAYALAHAAVRTVLSCYTGVAARDLCFIEDDFGKPALAGWGSRLSFNLSRTEGLAVLAVTSGRRIGVDVERIHPSGDEGDVARRFFSRRENRDLNALPRPARPSAFFTCWTRKEAFVKALGQGLSIPLDAFDVSVAEGQPGLLNSRLPGVVADEWTIRDLQVGSECVSAFALEGENTGISFRSWDWVSSGLEIPVEESAVA